MSSKMVGAGLMAEEDSWVASRFHMDQPREKGSLSRLEKEENAQVGRAVGD
jgi:hypothetical protein